jgi:hypothetical protein
MNRLDLAREAAEIFPARMQKAGKILSATSILSDHFFNSCRSHRFGDLEHDLLAIHLQLQLASLGQATE